MGSVKSGRGLLINAKYAYLQLIDYAQYYSVHTFVAYHTYIQRLFSLISFAMCGLQNIIDKYKENSLNIPMLLGIEIISLLIKSKMLYVDVKCEGLLPTFRITQLCSLFSN